MSSPRPAPFTVLTTFAKQKWLANNVKRLQNALVQWEEVYGDLVLADLRSFLPTAVVLETSANLKANREICSSAARERLNPMVSPALRDSILDEAFGGWARALWTKAEILMQDQASGAAPASSGNSTRL